MSQTRLREIAVTAGMGLIDRGIVVSYENIWGAERGSTSSCMLFNLMKTQNPPAPADICPTSPSCASSSIASRGFCIPTGCRSKEQGRRPQAQTSPYIKGAPPAPSLRPSRKINILIAGHLIIGN
ncbi:hypothetical protein, partial [Mesorhizobium sp. M2A.F.Ca.ET.067.02.1.1]|uniref:hypothetical protein n=1 Tax=Mesorhizobium sp. M2A.F.Ca.ET.067.02.1.1 TaxID=2496749 RepID=UPI001AECCB3C